MSLPQQIASIYQNLVGSQNLRLVGTQPAAGAAGATVTAGKAAYGAWATLVAVSTITDPSWLVGAEVDTPAVDADIASADESINMEVGTGTAGSEVALAEIAMSYHHIKLTAVGEWTNIILPITLARAIKMIGAPRLAARGATDDAGATHAYNVKALLGTLF